MNTLFYFHSVLRISLLQLKSVTERQFALPQNFVAGSTLDWHPIDLIVFTVPLNLTKLKYFYPQPLLVKHNFIT